MDAMKSSSYTFFVLLLAVHGSLQKSSPTSPTYRAAVVEFKPILYKNDSAKTLNENVVGIEKYIKRASRRRADIIVFPELVPTTVAFPVRQALLPWATELPDPKYHRGPCTSNDLSVSEAIRKIGCAAKRHRIYVAINVIEREKYGGRNCPHDDFSFYISSVVFDRKGLIISRYRKSYLFDERGVLDVVNSIENATFFTDFGVNFSHIIGSDILFKKPWLDIARETNVTDFIYQAASLTRLPFLSPIQIHAGWSYAEDINLLAAGYNDLKKGFTGSGIYAGRDGIITAVMNLRDQEELLIANITKRTKLIEHPPILELDAKGRIILTDDTADRFGYQIRNESLRRNESMNNFLIENDTLRDTKTKLITENGTYIDELSDDGIECKFEVNVTNLIPPSSYRLIAFDGPWMMSMADTISVKICSIISCRNITLDSCGRLDDKSSTIFQSIRIEAVHIKNQNITTIPNTLGRNLFPLRNWYFDRKLRDNYVHSLMYLPEPSENLLTFGIWGRNYDKDNVNSAVIKISYDLLDYAIFLIIMKIIL